MNVQQETCNKCGCHFKYAPNNEGTRPTECVSCDPDNKRAVKILNRAEPVAETPPAMVKCTFLLPLHDNRGEAFPSALISRVKDRLLAEFGGITVAGKNTGFYTMADGTIAGDRTETIIVCVDDQAGVDRLRKLVAELGYELRQECMYFEVSTARVEFIPSND